MLSDLTTFHSLPSMDLRLLHILGEIDYWLGMNHCICQLNNGKRLIPFHVILAREQSVFLLKPKLQGAISSTPLSSTSTDLAGPPSVVLHEVCGILFGEKK